jgi:Glycosyl hydrolase family 30 beta sandwich domain
MARRFLFPVVLIAITVVNCHRASSSGKAVITLDPSTTYQTVVGWEANAQSGQTDSLAFPKYKDQLFEQTVNDLGISRVRVEIRSGAEHTIDYFSQYVNGRINRNEWKQHWYEIINDNDDPLLINPEGFQFAELDHIIDTVVRPLKQRLESRGEKLYVNLNVVDFACCKGRSNLRYQERPDEYAEFVLATFIHLRNKYGWVPDAVEVILEPDNAGWSGIQIGLLIVSTGKLLKAHGFNPGFIAPSNANMANAITWFDQMIQVSEVSEFLSEFSYHRYGGVSESNLAAIAARALRYKVNTSMLEHIGSGHEDFHQDLKIGRNSAWQQFTLAYPTKDNGAQYYWIDDKVPTHPKIIMGSRTKLLRQYFKFVRSGAVRVEAKTSNNNYDPVAFVNADGKYVVVIKASQGGSFSIQGLPPATYGIKYTTSSQYDIDEPDVTIGSVEPLTARIPESGVVTVYARGQSKL